MIIGLQVEDTILVGHARIECCTSGTSPGPVIDIDEAHWATTWSGTISHASPISSYASGATCYSNSLNSGTCSLGELASLLVIIEI
jgi:hypothetical protein